MSIGASIATALAGLIPTVLRDLWSWLRPKPKDAAPGGDSVPAPTLPSGPTNLPVDSAPGAAVPDEDDDGGEQEDIDDRPPRQPYVGFKCAPASGVYLIDAERKPAKCPCGEGVVVGVPWVRRAWAAATGQAYWYVTRKKDVGANKGKGYVQWTPALRESGTYEVWVRVPGRFNRTAGAQYLIRTANGSVMAKIDQRGVEADDVVRWKLLGQFNLAKEECFVRLLNTAGHSEGADSLGLRKVGTA